MNDGTGMSRARAAIEIETPAGVAWEALADLGKIHLFNPHLTGSHLIGDSGACGVGTRRRCDLKMGGALHEEIVAWRPGESYTVDVVAPSMPVEEMRTTLAVRPLGPTRCEVSMECRYRPKYGTIGRAMDAILLGPMMRRMFRGVLVGLKRHLVGDSCGACARAVAVLALAFFVQSVHPLAASAAPASAPAPRAATRPGAPAAAEILERAIRAHGGREAWRAKGTAVFSIEMTRMDTAGIPVGPAMPFRIAFPTSGAAEIEAQGADGSILRYTDGRVEVQDPDGNLVEVPAALAQARFMLPTFQYILSLPWKLLDPGVRTEALADRSLDGRRLVGVRVTYAPGVGETPDDWYRYYFDAETGRLRDVLWIITAPGHDDTIEWCRFEDLREVEGLVLPRRWVFTPATEDGTEIGPPMMEVRLVDLLFDAEEAETRPATRPAASRPAASRPAP